jgi:hypothetical protein
MKHRLAVINHALHLTWLEFEEGENLRNLLMNRVIVGNNDGKYTTTYSGVKAKLTPYLVNFHAVFVEQTPRRLRQTRGKKVLKK